MYLCNNYDADKSKLHTFLIDTFKYTTKTGEGLGKWQTNSSQEKLFYSSKLKKFSLLYQNRRLIVDLMQVYKYLHGKKT